MKNKKEIYYEYFEKEILPKVQPIEKERKKIARSVILLSLLCFFIGIILALIIVVTDFDNIYKILLFPIIMFTMYAFVIKSIINFIVAGKEYQKMLYEKVLPLFLKPIANFKNWPENQNTENIIDSQLFGNFDTQEDVKCFFGYYNKTNILISDCRLSLPIKGINKPNLFKGTLIQLELEKSINNHVIIFSKNEKKHNKYKQINPHIDEMNEFVYIFAKNDNINFINNDFWNSIKKFGEAFTAKGFKLSFKDNTMIIAIKQKRPMLFGFLFHSLLKQKNYDELIDRFVAIFELVDILN